MPIALVVLCSVFIVLPIALLIAAVILRAAVSLANSVIGPEFSRSIYALDDEEDAADEDDFRPRRRRRYRDSGRAIPEPGVGRGMVIVLVIGIANFAAGIVIAVMVGAAAGAGARDAEDAILTARLISLPIGFLIGSAILAGMLPTSFGRACLVTLFEYLIIAVIAGVIVGALFVAGGGLRPFGR